MNQLKCILVVIDKRMRSTTALERGVALARKYRAQLHLCIFDHDPLIERAELRFDSEAIQSARKQFLAERERWLAAQAAAWEDHDVSIKYDVVWAPEPHEAILKKVKQIGADLLIKDVRSEPMQQRLSHSPLDRRILSYCPAPLMLVGPSAKYRPRRIVVAVDTKLSSYRPGPLNDELFGAAEWICRAFDAEVHVAHVTMPFRYFEATNIPLAEIQTDFLSSESKVFAEICSLHNVPTENQHLLNGDIAIELTRFTQRMDIDMIVLGANYCSAENRFMLGNTVESLLGQLDCDLLLVKNADGASSGDLSAEPETIRNDRKPLVT